MKLVSQNIRYLRELLDLNQTSFGSLFGLSRDNIASYERGSEPKMDILRKMAQHFRVNVDELVNKDLREMGVVMPSETAKDGAPSGKSNQAIPLIAPNALRDVGNSPFTIDEKHVLAWYALPNFRDIDFLLRVQDDIMAPKYIFGDVVACRFLSQGTLITWNKPHVFATKEMGPNIRRMMKGPDEHTIAAISDNNESDPIYTPLSAINCMALVVGVIHLEQH